MGRNMKKRFLLLVVLIFGVMAFAACAKEEPKQEETSTDAKVISTEELSKNIEDDSWVVVDTRLNDAYNGWKLEGVKRGGHTRSG